jgi:hypothetical protein
MGASSSGRAPLITEKVGTDTLGAMRTAHEVFLNEDNYGVTRLDAVEFQEKDTVMQGHSIWHVANGARPAAQSCAHPDRSLPTGFACGLTHHYHGTEDPSNPQELA